MIDTASFSERGPRQENEDAFLCEVYKGHVLLAVADGLGGHGGGALASKIAIDISRDWPADAPLSDLPRHIHGKIRKAQAETEFPEMATTLTLVRIIGDRLEGIHVGDTRCIIQRGNGIKKLTKSQTEAQRLFDAGKLTNTEFLNYPRRNILDSALGMKEDFKSEEFEFSLLPRDILVLTSDGVHEKVLLKPLFKLLHGTSSEIASNILEAVQKEKPEDNYTCVVAVIGES